MAALHKRKAVFYCENKGKKWITVVENGSLRYIMG